MCTQGGRTQEYVGALFGKTAGWVSLQRLLIDLVPEIQQQLEPNGSKNQLATSVAQQLARLPKE